MSDSPTQYWPNTIELHDSLIKLMFSMGISNVIRNRCIISNWIKYNLWTNDWISIVVHCKVAGSVDPFHERVKYRRKQAAAKYWSTNQSKPAQTFLSRRVGPNTNPIHCIYTRHHYDRSGGIVQLWLLLLLNCFPLIISSTSSSSLSRILCASFTSRTEWELMCNRDN